MDQPTAHPTEDHDDDCTPQTSSAGEVFGPERFGSSFRGRTSNDAFRKVRILGCSAALVILGGLMFAVYSSLKGTVWGTYEKVRDAVERSVVVTVPEQEKGRLLADIEAFDRLLRKADDPYPAMGAFVNQGRQVLADGVVDGDEVRALSSFLEGEIGDARD